jgi:hypothetical protein
MNKKDKELFTRIDEILHYLWDPIGISNEPAARDEYASYAPQILSMLKANMGLKDISKKLNGFAHIEAGVDADRMNNDTVAEILINYYEYISNKNT